MSCSATCSGVRLDDIADRLYGFFAGYMFGQLVVFRLRKLIPQEGSLSSDIT